MRTAFTLNTALKRLFLSSTQLTSAGAIALAEFLPESTSLLHLDLTVNNIDLAGVMALSKGLKSNHVIRCLDLNIPPDNEEFAKICREILNTCVRNTEEAERAARNGAGGVGGAGHDNGHVEDGHQGTLTSGKGLGKGVWGLIEESELAKSIRTGDGLHVKVERAFFVCSRDAEHDGGRFTDRMVLPLLDRSTFACRGTTGADPG